MKKYLMLAVAYLLMGLYASAVIAQTKKMNTKEIYFAGGCFWGTEHFLKQIRGVVSTEVGYANGNVANPTYKLVCQGNTQFAETVKVVYNPSEVSLSFLIDLYLKTIDPTSLNKQGNDKGSQYRTGIYYKDKADEPIIRQQLAALAKGYSKPIVVENLPLKNFYATKTIWIRTHMVIATSPLPYLRWHARPTLRRLPQRQATPSRIRLPSRKN